MNHLSIALFVLILIQSHGIFVHVEAGGGFVKTSGVHLVLNGSPFYANGFNAYWLMYEASDPSTKAKVTSTFQEATRHGLTVARTWAFSDGGYQALQNSPGSYNEQMFRGLDFVVSEAGKHGIKLILSLVNNYDNYGGRKQYVAWAQSHGQSVSSEDDFYTNPVVKGYYKNHIKAVLKRRNSVTGIAYKDDPTILAWELMNEPRCAADETGKTVQAWITEMASYLKSIDPSHLLEIGLEGFYGPSKKASNPNSYLVGTDFIANNQIRGIDFATVHSYPDQWISGSTEETQLSFMRGWLADHIRDAQNVLHKPVLFAEFGKSLKTASIAQRDDLFNTVFSAVSKSASGGGAAAGALFWHVLAEGMDSFRDGYEVILSEKSSTVNLIDQESQKLNRIRKSYVRQTDVQKWKKAHGSKSGNKGK